MRAVDTIAGHAGHFVARLRNLGLGIFARLDEPIATEKEAIEETPGNITDILEWRHYLGYGKCVGKSGNEWGLYVESDFGSDPKYRGIAELSRDDRVLVAKHLAALLDLLAAEAEKLVRQVQEARSVADDAFKKFEQ